MDLNNIDIESIEKYPLSDKDIKNIENTNIFKLSDIVNMDHIDECFDRLGRCIVLIQNIDYNTGHWASILKYNNCIELYEGYGLKKNELVKMDDNIINLFNLISKCGYKLITNNKKRQKKKDNINTCGRYALVRNLTYYKTLDEFNKFLDDITKNKKIDFDKFISVLTFLIMKK